MPLVSIIIPIFNREEIIEKTLKKLREQIYRPLEVIIVDDASTDKTVQKINKFIQNFHEEKFKINLYINEVNKGGCYSRNYGILHSKGKYIQFLDSDDFLNPIKISDQVTSLEKSKGFLAVSDYQYIKNDQIIKKCRNDGNLFKRVSLGWSIYTSSPLIKAALIKNNLKWNEKILFLQDKDFLFKVLMLAGKYNYLPGFTSNYVQHDNNQISDLYKIKKPQFFTIILSRLNFIVSFFFKLNFKIILYSLLGILQILIEFNFYYLKKFIIIFFGEKIFFKIKKIIRNN